MQYEFRSKTLTGVVRKSLNKAPQYERESSTTIESEPDSYNRERVSVFVEREDRYTISWSAHESVSDGGDYGIDIRSYDGHGSYRSSFRSSGSWDFVAKLTGEIEFSIGVSRSFGAAWSSYPVAIDID